MKVDETFKINPQDNVMILPKLAHRASDKFISVGSYGTDQCSSNVFYDYGGRRHLAYDVVRLVSKSWRRICKILGSAMSIKAPADTPVCVVQGSVL